MLFTSATYGLFFVGVLLAYWALRNLTARKILLLAASYLFYAAWDWRFLSLILLSTAVDWIAARQIASSAEPRSRKAWVSISLLVNLGMLGIFKYLGFFVDSARELLARFGSEIPDSALAIVLPVGISFYTFQTLSYTIDVYRGRLEPVRSPVDLALFVAFFPQLVAGPIVRAATFLPQLGRMLRLTDVDWRACSILFLTGYVKKACLADNLALVVDPVFADPSGYAWSSVCLAAIGFTVQIYGDFSGYTDMAIASAGMLGFQLPKNFDFPFVSKTPAEFWRRWHISLSSWLRDYLYISLGGNRAGTARTYRNLMTTMLLGGLWHGAAWTFVLWGAVHGTALVIHRAVAARLASSAVGSGEGRVQPGSGRVSALVRGLPGLVLTLAVVVGAFVLFRAESLEAGLGLLSIASGLAPAGSAELHGAWWGVVVGFALLHAWGASGTPGRIARAAPGWGFAAAYGVAWSAALAFTAYAPAPFIYFQF